MAKINLRPLMPLGAALAVCIAVAAALGMALAPKEPVLEAVEKPLATSQTYRPGGPGCAFDRLRALRGAEAVVEQSRCDEAYEQHRLVISDLKQQTRAASAAEAAAKLAFKQTIIALAATIVGIFTLLAAIAAALYAKRAADTAEKSVGHSRETAQAELRPYLISEAETVVLPVDEGDGTYKMKVRLRNGGSTPAHDVFINTKCSFRYKNQGVERYGDGAYSVGAMSPAAWNDIEITCKPKKLEIAALSENRGLILGEIEVKYKDTFDEDWVYKQRVMITTDSLANNTLYTSECTTSKADPSPLKRAARSASARPGRPANLIRIMPPSD